MTTLLIPLLLAAFSPSGDVQISGTWEGFVTDTHCGTNCQRTSAMSPDRACVRRCVKQGSKYGLWFGNHVYVLEPQSEASKFSAENVRVVGEMANDTITIKSISQLSPKTQ